MKYWLLGLFSITLFLSGCSAPQDPKEKLAMEFVEAISDNDEDDLWELFSPEMQKKMVAEFGKSEDETKEETLDILKKMIQEKYSVKDLEDLEDNTELRTRISKDIAGKNDNMINIDGKWYINLL